MKITNVRAHVLEARLSQPFAYARAWYSTRTAMLVEIETDQGLIGWGECYGPARINAAVRPFGMTYSVFINGLSKSGITVDRKVLSDLAINEPVAFQAIAEKAKAALAA